MSGFFSKYGCRSISELFTASNNTSEICFNPATYAGRISVFRSGKNFEPFRSPTYTSDLRRQEFPVKLVLFALDYVSDLAKFRFLLNY